MLDFYHYIVLVGPESPKVEDAFDSYPEMALEASKKQQMALKIAAKKVRINFSNDGSCI